MHPYGLCESEDVGAGTRVWAFGHVMRGAVVGRDCNICDHAFIEDGAVLGDRVTVKNAVLVWNGVTIEDDAFVGPAATFTNDRAPRSRTFATGRPWLARTHVGRGASVGANATVLAGVTIGAFAVVGAGAVLLNDVPAHAIVVGNPARPVGWACTCGERLPDSLQCGTCARRFRFDAAGGVAETANETL